MSGHASEQERAHIREAREAWFDEQPELDPARLIFIDETGINTKMARLRGPGRQGEQLLASIPHAIGAPPPPSSRGSGSGASTRRWCSTRRQPRGRFAMAGEAFLAYVRRVLVPLLRPGDVIVMDNLGCHKGAGVGAAIAATGAE